MNSQENYNIELNKLKKEDVELLCNSVKEACQLNSCQLYNPIMTQYMKFYNNSYSHNAFTFNTKYTIIEIKKHREAKNKRDSFKGVIVKNYNKKNDNSQWKDNVFIKITPLLEVYPFMKNKYNINSEMPNVFHYLTTCKLNSTNNNGYLEAFCNMMTSWLTENGKCPTFPYYYGTVTGMSKAFKYDITEEYKGIRKTKWFKQYNNVLYTVEKKSLDDSLFNNLEEYDEDHLPHFSFDSSLESDYGFNHMQKDSFKANKFNNCDIDELSSCSDDEQLPAQYIKNKNTKKTFEVEEIDLGNDADNSESESSQTNDYSDPENYNNSSNCSETDNEGTNSETYDSNSDIDDDDEDDDEYNINDIDIDDKDDNNDVKDDNNDVNNHEKTEKTNSINKKKNKDIEKNNNKLKVLKTSGVNELKVAELNKDNLPELDLGEISDIEDDILKNASKNSSENLKIIPGLNENDFLMDATYNVVIPNFPVQIICMESLDITLDEYVSKYKVSFEEWLSIIFQICFGLAVGQKHFALTHNDLHGNNIMFKKTGLRYLYFHYNGTYFRIPTFQKITKIIDFTRSVFQVNDKLYFSDVFRKEGDAEGQYSYPYKNDLEKCYHKPNKSFDLARLATTIARYFKPEEEIYKLLLSWMTDKNGNNLGEEEDSFDLYIKIARGVDNAVPKEQLSKSLFNLFHIDKNDIPQNSFIYYF
jgi:hypothetical protein